MVLSQAARYAVRAAICIAEICVLEVIHAIEGTGFGCACFLGLGKCDGDDPCALHHEWTPVRDQLLGSLRDNTIHDLITRGTVVPLTNLLGE